MKMTYHPETDSLYIDLVERPGAEAREILEGLVLDYDLDGGLVGIDIDNASVKVDLKRIALSRFPGRVENVYDCPGPRGEEPKPWGRTSNV